MARRATSVAEETDASPANRLASAVRKLKDFDEAVAMGSEPFSEVRAWISTQIATLDYAIRRPGIPTGRLTVVVGNEGASKSTVTDHMMIETQERGGIAILIDAESARDTERLRRMGLNTDELIIVKPHNLEMAFRTVEKLILELKATMPDTLVCIVVDSLAGLPAEASLEKEIGESNVALVSRAMSGQILPRLVPLIENTLIALVIVNQLRMYIAPFNGVQRAQERRKVMGNKAMIAEGPLVYWASLVIHVATTGVLGERDNPTGISVRATMKKNRVGPGEGHQAEYNVDYMWGADRLQAKFDLLVKIGVIKESGGWFKIDGREMKGFRASEWPEIYEQWPELEDYVQAAPTNWRPERYE